MSLKPLRRAKQRRCEVKCVGKLKWWLVFSFSSRLARFARSPLLADDAHCNFADLPLDLDHVVWNQVGQDHERVALHPVGGVVQARVQAGGVGLESVWEPERKVAERNDHVSSQGGVGGLVRCTERGEAHF